MTQAVTSSAVSSSSRTELAFGTVNIEQFCFSAAVLRSGMKNRSLVTKTIMALVFVWGVRDNISLKLIPNPHPHGPLSLYQGRGGDKISSST